MNWAKEMFALHIEVVKRNELHTFQVLPNDGGVGSPLSKYVGQRSRVRYGSERLHLLCPRPCSPVPLHLISALQNIVAGPTMFEGGNCLRDFGIDKVVHLCTQRYAKSHYGNTEGWYERVPRQIRHLRARIGNAVAITRHGDTVGYFIPARRRRTDADKDALREAATRWQQTLEAEGISEDEAVADFKRWRAKQKR